MKIWKNLYALLPTFGILTFIGLCVYAATLYPGGSQADANSVGFDWYHNYWCNLMSEKGMNGQDNPARPYSIFAMVLLCLSMIRFFFQFARAFVVSKFWKLTIIIAGILSMGSAMFIFTSHHDVMTTILSVGGVFGIFGIIRTLHKNKMTFYKISGIICIVIIGVNNLMYYDKDLIEYLPLLQKFSFILILAWTIGLNNEILKIETQRSK